MQHGLSDKRRKMVDLGKKILLKNNAWQLGMIGYAKRGEARPPAEKEEEEEAIERYARSMCLEIPPTHNVLAAELGNLSTCAEVPGLRHLGWRWEISNSRLLAIGLSNLSARV